MNSQNHIIVLGADAIVIEDCGHIFDAKEWADEISRAGEFDASDLEGKDG